MKRVFAFSLAVIMLITAMSIMTGCCLPTNQRNPSTQTPVQNTQGQNATQSQDQDETEATEPEIATEPPVVNVSLAELPVISNDDYLDDDDVKDSYGNEYAGPYFDLFAYGTAGEITGKTSYTKQAKTELKADGQYRYLTGTYFARSEQKENADVEFMVYADGELVYYSGPIRRKDKAINFAIDIGNCDIITITARSYDAGGMDSTPGIILVNAMVTNEFDGILTEGEYLNTNLYSLADCHIYSSNSDIEGGTVTDAFGNVHKGIYLDLVSHGEGLTAAKIAKVEFAVNGEYRYLSGTYFANADQNENIFIEMYIYADDELVYQSGGITRNDKAVDFTVDVGNCDIIRIETKTDGDGLSNKTPSVVLMNPMVSNEEP